MARTTKKRSRKDHDNDGEYDNVGALSVGNTRRSGRLASKATVDMQDQFSDADPPNKGGDTGGSSKKKRKLSNASSVDGGEFFNRDSTDTDSFVGAKDEVSDNSFEPKRARPVRRSAKAAQRNLKKVVAMETPKSPVSRAGAELESQPPVYQFDFNLFPVNPDVFPMGQFAMPDIPDFNTNYLPAVANYSTDPTYATVNSSYSTVVPNYSTDPNYSTFVPDYSTTVIPNYPIPQEVVPSYSTDPNYLNDIPNYLSSQAIDPTLLDPLLESYTQPGVPRNAIYAKPPVLSRERLVVDSNSVHLYAEQGAADLWASALSSTRWNGPRQSPPFRELYRLSDPMSWDTSDWAENIRWAKEQERVFGSKTWTEYDYDLERITEIRRETYWVSEEAIRGGP